MLSIYTLFAKWNFNRIINKEIKTLLANTHPENEIITSAMLEGLPEAVRLWLTNCGIVGKEKVYTVRLKQKGLMKTKPG